MKRISSKRAKALQIPTRVKKIVYERDNGLCVVCGRMGIPEAHYIPRSAGGLGVEQNIVCLCRECHDRFDFGVGEEMALIAEVIRAHLQECYPDWNEDELYYKKYGGAFMNNNTERVRSRGNGPIQRMIKRFMEMNVQVAEFEHKHYSNVKCARTSVWKSLESMGLNDRVHVIVRDDRMFLMRMDIEGIKL